MNTLLTQAIDAYSLAESVLPERHRISCPPMRRFSKALQVLVRQLGDEAALPLWEDLLESAKAVRWRAGTEAVPFDATTSGAQEPLSALRQQAERLENLIDAERQTRLRTLLKAAEELAEEGNRALSSAVLETIRDGDPADTCVVAARGRAAAALEAWLHNNDIHVPVFKPRDFMLGRHWDFAVIVGPVDWFPPQMFTCPRASAITLVHYAHIADSERIKGVFGASATVALSVTIRGAAQESAGDEDTPGIPDDSAKEQAPQPAWDAILRHAAPSAGEHSDYPVQARLLVLAHGQGLWLPVDATSIRGLDLTASQGERVLHLKAKAVTAGSYLVVRENGTMSGTLAALADVLLGSRASQIRERQQHWKALLRRLLATQGNAQVEQQLRRAGAVTANLRHWASDDNIRPRYDHDFALLLKLLGVEDPTPHIADGHALWSAHHRAGVQLTAALEDLIEEADLRELKACGHQQLQLTQPGVSVTLSVFEVLAINDEVHEVAASATRRPFKVRGTQWLE